MPGVIPERQGSPAVPFAPTYDRRKELRRTKAVGRLVADQAGEQLNAAVARDAVGERMTAEWAEPIEAV